MKSYRLSGFLWYLLAVPRCAVCRELLSAEDVLRGYVGADVLCPSCRAEWESEKLESCEMCGLPMLDCRCMPDLLSAAGAKSLICLADYRPDGAVGRLILRLKTTKLRRAAKFTGKQLAAGIRRECQTCGILPENLLVTWCPRSKEKRRRIGHDQAELLARVISASLGCTRQPLFLRAAEGQAQKLLGAEERVENASTLFVRNSAYKIDGRAILLVDDIVTTGATMAHAVALLRADGAEVVFCAAAARSRLRKNKK